MDYSQFSTDDLKAMQAGDISKVSSAGLKAMQAQMSASNPPVEKMQFANGAENLGTSKPVSMLAGIGTGIGKTALGAQKLVGMGLSKVGEMTSDAPSVSDLVAGKRPTNMIARAGQWLENDADTGRARMDQELTPYVRENPKTTAVGKLGGEVIATLPVGGVLGKGVALAAPELAATARGGQLINAIASGGLKTGAPVAATLGEGAKQLGIRTIGAGITGGASSALINPENPGMGTAISALTPTALKTVGKVAGYAGKGAKALIQPLTTQGQQELAANLLRRFGDGGPMNIDTSEIVHGSTPTLAEATGNAGIAGLQRVARDLRPNAFTEREAENAAARNSLFDSVAGDTAQLEFYKASRSQAGKELYDAALNRAPEATTPYVKGQITQLLKRPSIDEASRVAQRWAIERGEKPSLDGSLRALHDVKQAIDDKIAASVQAGQGGEVKALQATKAKLLDVMEKMSPEYGDARSTYAGMSKPVNAMEALQGLKLSDMRGNMTLAKVQNAIAGLEKLRSAPGANNAKSVTDDQMKALTSIRDDLLRQDKMGLGRSAGSNTFQNLATDNLLANLLPGRVGAAINGKIGTAVGQGGKLLYSGANEKIKNNVLDMMLDPEIARKALATETGASNPKINYLLDLLSPAAYRSVPALSNSR